MNKRLIAFIIEISMLLVLGVIAYFIAIGNPRELNYSQDIFIPYLIIYVGVFAIRTFLLRSQSSVKYVFYAGLLLLSLSLRFYERFDLFDQVKWIGFGAIGILGIYHIISLIQASKLAKA